MTMQTLKPLFQSDNDIVISHGNGPQIGNLLIQQSQSDSEQTPAMPLDVCGSMTQGMIGYWLETEINRVLSEIGSDRAVGTIITRVEVDKDDPRFDRPTKPIGPFYTEEEMQELKEAQPEAIYKADSAGRGYRKVVASPLPISILEHKLISTLVEQKISSLHVVVAVYLLLRKIILMKVSTPSLIKTSLAKLAALIDADTLMILTNVEHVYINFKEPNEEKLTDIDVETLKRYAKEGKFAEGSMLPKIEAAIDFVESGEHKEAIITNLENAYQAFDKQAGTYIHK